MYASFLSPIYHYLMLCKKEKNIFMIIRLLWMNEWYILQWDWIYEKVHSIWNESTCHHLTIINHSFVMMVSIDWLWKLYLVSLFFTIQIIQNHHLCSLQQSVLQRADWTLYIYMINLVIWQILDKSNIKIE